MKPVEFLSHKQWRHLFKLLDSADQRLANQYPGSQNAIQPLHTIYVPADQIEFNAGGHNINIWSQQAYAFSLEHADILATLTPDRIGIDKIDLVAPPPLDPQQRLQWVQAQLQEQAIVDFRIDFEDGYGDRGDIIEDQHATQAAQYINYLHKNQPSPRYMGIRTKGLLSAERSRMLRTLEIVLTEIATNNNSYGSFIFTVPKIRALEQVEALVLLCEAFEQAHGLPEVSLRFELQIESPQAIFTSEGAVFISQALQLAKARCWGLPYGTYDFSAALGIASAYQSLLHPVADFAKFIMQISAAHIPVWISDGSTQVFPVGNSSAVQCAIERHYHLVYRALGLGLYQGWDMHPGQLVTRFLANYDFFSHAIEVGAPRLNAYIARLSSDIIDEPATACALAKVIARAVDLGIISEEKLYERIPMISQYILKPRALLTAIINRSPLESYKLASEKLSKKNHIEGNQL